LNTFRKIALSFFWAIVFWMSFAFVMAWEDRVRALQRGAHPSYWHYVLVETGMCVTFALMTPAIFAIVRRYPVTRETRFLRGAAYLLGAFPFIIAFSCLRWAILPPWSSAHQEFVPRTFDSFLLITTTFADQTWTYLATVVAAHAFTYMQERLELLQAVTTSELQALKSQIHPHFLFNTLHGISTLIDYDKTKAKAMIVMLANLLRTALKQGHTDLIALHEELKFVEDYLAIEKVRLGERLDVRWDIDADTRGLLVPQLILQPLLENAIVHGIACCREGGWVQVASRKHGQTLEIQIANSMCGLGQKPGMGVGLQNIRSRLRYLYSEEATFEFKTHDYQFATATMILPAFYCTDKPVEISHAGEEVRSARSDR
jgi:hypothetical protein